MLPEIKPIHAKFAQPLEGNPLRQRTEALDTALVRFSVPAQPVDATPSNQLIRQYFPLENRSVRLYSIRPSQGGVSFESTLANDFWAVEAPLSGLRASVASTH